MIVRRAASADPIRPVDPAVSHVTTAPSAAMIGGPITLIKALSRDCSAISPHPVAVSSSVDRAQLKAAKSLKSPDVAEISRQYSPSITKYRSKTPAYSSIEKAFVREVGFEK